MYGIKLTIVDNKTKKNPLLNCFNRGLNLLPYEPKT